METIKEMVERLVTVANYERANELNVFLFELIDKSPYSLDELINGLIFIQEELKKFEQSVEDTPEITKPKKGAETK